MKAVKAEVRIPVAVKLGPYFSSMANMAPPLDAAGANALVLFNRFYQPDYDLESLEVVPNLILSNSHELLLRLHWIAVIYGSIQADLALTGGVHTATDVVKVDDGRRQRRYDDLGAVEARHQLPGHPVSPSCWCGWASTNTTPSARCRGSMSRSAVTHPTAFERANYMKVLGSYAMR